MVSRRLARLTLGLSFCLSVACLGVPAAQAAGRDAAPISLTFASWDPAAVTTLFINGCAQKYNLTVTNRLVPYASYATKIQTEFAAGTAPDFFYGLEDHTLAWGAAGQLLDQVPLRKALNAPVDRVLPQSRWWDHGKVGSKLIGAGAAVEDMFLYYNKNVFAQAGVAAPPSDAAHAWTWDQFVAVAKKLTIDRHGRHPDDAGFDARHIARYGTTVGDAWSALLPFVYSNGGDAFDASYQHFILNQPAAAAAVQAVADLTVKDHVAPTVTQMAAGAANGLTLASGRVAMMVSGNWDIYFQQNPTKTYPMGIGVLPRFKQYRTIVVGGPLVVWSHSQHPREAMEMVACIAQNSAPLWKNGIWMPTTQDQYSASAVKTWATSPAHPANYQSVAIDTLQYAHSAPEIATSQFTPAWVDVVQPALDQIFTGHGTAQSILTGIKPRVDAVLSQGR